jgi:hypothetical protein
LTLLPLALAASLVPTWIVINILLLRSQRGLPSAVAFVVGITLWRVVVGALFAPIFAHESVTARSGGGPSDIVATLLIALGVLGIAVALKLLSSASDHEVAPLPLSWLSVLSSVGRVKAFGLGLFLAATSLRQWIFFLAALATIAKADLGDTQSTVVYLGFVATVDVPMIVPILFYAIARTRARGFLDWSYHWLEANNRGITIVVSGGFGIFFLVRGIVGLVG